MEKGSNHLLCMRKTLGCHSDQTLVCKLFFSCIKGGRDLFPWEPAVIRLFGASKLSKSVGLCCLHTQVWSPWHHKRSIHSTMAFQASHKIGKLGLNFGYSHQRFLKARLVAGLHFNFFVLSQENTIILLHFLLTPATGERRWSFQIEAVFF